MALNHNQYAVAAIAATLCLAGIYTVIGAAISSTDTGGFDSAVDDIFITEDENPKECPEDVATVGCDWDGDGIPDRMEQTLYGTNWQKADTDGDGLEDGERRRRRHPRPRPPRRPHPALCAARSRRHLRVGAQGCRSAEQVSKSGPQRPG